MLASLQRQPAGVRHDAADDLAGAQIGVGGVDLVEPARGNRNVRQSLAPHQLHHLGHFWQTAEIRTLDGQSAHRDRRQRYREVAAVQSDDDVFAALDQAVEADTRARRRADQVDRRPGAGAVFGQLHDLLHGVGRSPVDHRGRACALGGLALGRIDVDDDGRVPAHFLMQAETHQPEPAGADDHRRLILECRHLLQGAEGGDTRASERRRALRRQVADAEQIARMRHHHEVGIAAVGKHAEAAHGAAQILVAAQADRAGAATDPWVGKQHVAYLDALGVGPDRHHFADVLVAERHRQLHAAVLQAHALAAAEIEIAVGKMQVAVADAGGEHLQQDLRAGRLRRRRLVALERLAADADLEHAHGRFSPERSGCRRRACAGRAGNHTRGRASR